MTPASSFDWEAHWATAERDDLDEMRAAGERMADRLERYFDAVPGSLADVGCGPGFTLFALASDHPDSEFVGVDAAESVVRRNCALARERGLDNLAFRTGSLPDLSLDRTFQCVTCIATLHYVADVEAALEALFAHVEPGGTLIFNYPNRHTQATYRDDPDADPDRFELVLDGENLLTYRDVRRTLSRRPRSFWKAVGADDWESIGRTNPCVVIEK